MADSLLFYLRNIVCEPRRASFGISTVELSILLVVFVAGLASTIGWIFPFAKNHQEGFDFAAAAQLTKLNPPLLSGLDAIAPLAEYPVTKDFGAASPLAEVVTDTMRARLAGRFLNYLQEFAGGDLCAVVFIPAQQTDISCSADMRLAEIFLSYAKLKEAEDGDSDECLSGLEDGSACVTRELRSHLLQWDCAHTPHLAVFRLFDLESCAIMRLESELLHRATKLNFMSSMSGSSSSPFGGGSSSSASSSP